MADSTDSLFDTDDTDANFTAASMLTAATWSMMIGLDPFSAVLNAAGVAYISLLTKCTFPPHKKWMPQAIILGVLTVGVVCHKKRQR